MSDFQRKYIRAKVRQVTGITTPPAIIGDELGNVQDFTIPGNVLVRFQYQNGFGKAVSVLGPVNVVKLTPGAPVDLIWNPTLNRHQIRSSEPIASVISGNNFLAQSLPQADSGGFVGQQSIVTALVTPQSTPDLTVVVKSWLVATGGVFTSFRGSGTLDLSLLVPSAGENCYVVVFIEDDYATLIAVASTARLIPSVPLGDADVQECLTAAPINAVPLAVIKLIGGQTAITNADIVHDLRQMINSDPGEYTASVSTTDNTTTTLITFTVLASTTVAIHSYITARRTGGSSGTAEDGAYYERAVAVKNVAGTATIIGSIASIATMEDQAGWDATFDVTGATVRCRILGATNNNVNWKARFKVMKVS
jgi:hypothetical protein